ncbi:Ankyrin repeats (3 copies) [Planctomycetes bacterium CA13]|uniref:Ankyrin repeats (3 copies) n=1 Tax=Novipirellula herctigrandis TaxID=2527986 RepID=A0A5C5YZU5_9BACT|nr:Ankyrin repeats (3 copies) [Planctomycetes bacterium CA13]
MITTQPNKPSSIKTGSLVALFVLLGVGLQLIMPNAILPFAIVPDAIAQEVQPKAAGEKPKVKFSDDSFRRAALDGNMQIVKLALDSGSDPDAKDAQGHTAMHYAAFNGHTKVVEFLLGKGVDVNVVDGEGKTPLIHASSGPFNETVVFLLDHKAKIDHADATEGFTALMMAAAEGQLEVVETLLKRGADPTTVDVDGETAEIFAANNGHSKVVAMIQKFDVDQANSSWQADAKLVVSLSEKRSEFNYDESKVPAYTLPDPLVDSEGKPITKPEQWYETRRDEVVELFRENVFGRRPETDYSVSFETTSEVPDALGGIATGRSMKAIVKIDNRTYEFPFTVFVPNNSDAKAPAIVLINNRKFISLEDALGEEDPFWPVKEIVQSGCATASFFTSDVDPDDKDGYDKGIRAFFSDRQMPADDAWRSLSAWGWAASRVLDYVQTLDAVDASHVAVVGHSRGGKTALWAAVEDPRFAIAYSNNSGCGGAALSRRAYGETVGRITSAFPHWFVPRFGQFAGRESELPIDQHELIALVAPRGVYVTSSDEDLWADPKGEYESLKRAAPVFTLLGESSITEPTMPSLNGQRIVGKTGYHIREGGHGLTSQDWALFLNFAKPILMPSAE